MKEYTVYFELFGKKMKTTVHALSEERAKDRLRDKIVFHRIEEVKDNTDFMNQLFKAMGL